LSLSHFMLPTLALPHPWVPQKTVETPRDNVGECIREPWTSRAVIAAY
jgi:hypothetical protein